MSNLSDFNPDSNTIDFEQCLKYLEMVGQKHLNPKFKIIPEDHQLIFKLLVYFYKDLPNVERYGLDLKKGILLSGPIGCGKTSLFQLLRFYLQREDQYIVKPAREIVLEFLDEGHKVINKYSFAYHHFINGEVHHKILCIDDLGIESTIKYYGNETNVIGEIILSRHRLYTDHGAITHATTNLSAQELENIYGNRVRSRMREMFNLMAYPSTSKDKRK